MERFLQKLLKPYLKNLVENGGDAEAIVKEKGLVQISDEGALLKMVNRSDSITIRNLLKTLKMENKKQLASLLVKS